jgi:hypothetical protein
MHRQPLRVGVDSRECDGATAVGLSMTGIQIFTLACNCIAIAFSTAAIVINIRTGKVLDELERRRSGKP